MSRDKANVDLAALESGVAAALTAVSEDFPEVFEDQRRMYGFKCMGMLRKANRASKRVFRNLGKGDMVEADIEFGYCKEYCKELLENLKALPQLIAAEVANDAGQELVEAAMGIAFYPVLIGEKELGEISLPTCEDLDTTPQAWLAGVADFSSEVSKLAEQIRGRLIRRGLLKISERELGDRLLAIIDGITKYFDRYDPSYPKMLNASNRRFQGFSSKERMVGMASLWAVKMLNGIDEPIDHEEES